MSENLKAMMASADALLNQDRYAEAAGIYALLAVCFPEQPDLHHVYALVLVQLNQWRAALGEIDHAIALDPVRAAFHRSRGAGRSRRD